MDYQITITIIKEIYTELIKIHPKIEFSKVIETDNKINYLETNLTVNLIIQCNSTV